MIKRTFTYQIKRKYLRGPFELTIFADGKPIIKSEHELDCHARADWRAFIVDTLDLYPVTAIIATRP